MRRLALLFLILSCIVFGAPQFARASDEARLLKIVALSRHGVRSPTQSEKMLDAWAKKTWPVWPVKRGELTERGARLISAMWQNLRAEFVNSGLLSANECPRPGAIFVRADVDERTRATARAILDGIAKDCPLGFAVLNGDLDPLFHPVKAGLYKFAPIPAATDVLGMTNGGLEKLQEDFSGTLALMNRISGPPDPALCARFTSRRHCELADLPNAVSVSHDGKDIRLVGGLSIASSMAEIFLLEYAQWPGVAAGWGQVNSSTLSQIMPIHSRIFDVINRAPVVAWAKGSSLLNEMTAALLGGHYDQRCNEAKLVIFVGHDTNLANIGGLLGINWQAKGYPLNDIPPGGALFFELWEKNAKPYIVARFYAQTPETLHKPFAKSMDISGHAPVAATVSAPPVVGEARFELSAFRELVSRATEGAPIAPPQKPAFDFNRVLPKP